MYMYMYMYMSSSRPTAGSGSRTIDVQRCPGNSMVLGRLDIPSDQIGTECFGSIGGRFSIIKSHPTSPSLGGAGGLAPMPGPSFVQLWHREHLVLVSLIVHHRTVVFSLSRRVGLTFRPPVSFMVDVLTGGDKTTTLSLLNHKPHRRNPCQRPETD